MKCCLTLLAFALSPILVCAGEKSPFPGPVQAKKIEYARDILPILSANCFTCHGPDAEERKAKLRLDLRGEAVKEARSGLKPIVPGDARSSEMMVRILETGRGQMPPARTQKSLKAHEKELLRQWIEQGAEYQKHWAFDTPVRPGVPKVKTSGWVRNPIDAFILARLEKEGLKPMPEADRYTLARRLALDLTGLPPTLEMVDRFVNDKRPDAYERYVDELMSLPAFGEHWAHVWLDLARYADSNGYATDKIRTIWKYRDWVIRAFNKNMPFDQFTIEQLAGDLLPSPSNDQLIATAFHRNTLTNDEGGTNDEEFRTVAVVDRVNTTMQVWMGLTMACAQCHNHKYDPLSQQEYFQLYAIFNQSQDADRGDDGPLLSLLAPEDQKKLEELETKLAKLQKALTDPDAELEEEQARWEKSALKTKLPANIAAILKLEAGKRNAAQKQVLAKHFRSITPLLRDVRNGIDATKKQIVGIKPVTTPIMRELPKNKQRVTKIHIRGNFLQQGDPVGPGVPELFEPLPKDAPKDRLALAKWLLSPQNPLTSRVAVNRFWQHLLGVGLMETPDDFGTRGKLPTHPELLDWLAIEFAGFDAKTREGHWDVKKLLRLIATSATYRQQSAVTPDLFERDPENRLFGRGPRHRSSAEVIRDQALFASGLLSQTLYGPPVRPYQPRLGLTAAFGGGTDWTTSKGEDRYRRALYTQWRRTTPYASMATFDAPSRTVCTVKRPRTNTPLQALVTLNDPCYVEAAQALARRIVREGGDSVAERVKLGFRLCLTRPPLPQETDRLVKLYNQVRAEYAKNTSEALALATDPLGPLPPGLDPVDMASWTVVSNVLLNLDEMFAKP